MEEEIIEQLIGLLPPQNSYGKEYNQLCKAFKECDVQTLKTYINLGLNVDVQLYDNHTPLTLLIGTSNAENWQEVAKLLLDSNCNPNARNPKGTTVLSLLVSSGEPSLVSLALDKGAKIEAKGSSNETALLTAVHFKQVQCLHILLERGANPNVFSEDGNSAVMWAAGRSNGIGSPKSLAAIKLLLKFGADPNRSNNRGYTPLMAASLIREAGTVRALIQAGANLDSVDFRGETALFKAIYSNCLETVNILLEAGADPNSQCKIRRTSLMLCNGYKIMNSLLLNKARVSLADCDGYTPLHHYAATNKTEFLRLLLIHGAGTESKCLKGNTPLQLAVRSRSTESMTFLISKNANVSTKNNSCVNLFHELIIPWDFFTTIDVFPIVNSLSLLREVQDYVSQSVEGILDGMRTLLSEGANASEPSTEGVTPLMLAALCGDADIVNFLLGEAKSDPYMEDGKGRSVLSYACRGGNIAIVKQLLKKGCFVNNLDDDGNFPLFYAAQFSFMKIAELLILDFILYIYSNDMKKA